MRLELPQKLLVLKELGSEDVNHNGRSLFAHLFSTYMLLDNWGCAEHVCDAGLFHSVYGTVENGILRQASSDERLAMERLLGGDCENLIFVFCRLDRPAFYRSIEENPGSPVLLPTSVPGGLAHFTAAAEQVSLQDLCCIVAANFIENISRCEPDEHDISPSFLKGFSRWLPPKAITNLAEALDQ